VPNEKENIKTDELEDGLKIMCLDQFFVAPQKWI